MYIKDIHKNVKHKAHGWQPSFIFVQISQHISGHLLQEIQDFW